MIKGLPLAAISQLQDVNVRALLWPIVLDFDTLKSDIVKAKKFKSAEDLYVHYMSQHTKKIHSQLQNDLYRSGGKCLKEFLLPGDSGQNPLFNILNAFAHYDTTLGYCQGMNCLAMFLVKTMMLPDVDKYKDLARIDKFNEVDTFFLLVHIVEKLDWGGVYMIGFTKLHHMLARFLPYLR